MKSVEKLYQEIGSPTEKRIIHNKVYTEPSVSEAMKDFEIKHGFSSLSEAGRALILIGLFHSAEYGK